MFRLPSIVLAVAAMLGSVPATAQHWIRSWAAAPVEAHAPGGKDSVPELNDRTLRQVVRLSAGGQRLRIRLSNEFSEAPLEIGAVHVALAGKDGAILPGTDRAVTFSGRGAFTVGSRAPFVSDAFDFAVGPLGRVAISIHFTAPAPRATWHPTAFATAWIAPGDQTAAVQLTDSNRYGRRLIIAAVDVERRRPATTVVTLGDSITDGAIATVDADTRWPDALAARLQAAGMRDVGVANAGIGSNRLLGDGYGGSALARLDRDVLSVPGVRHVIVMEGVNDIGMASARKDATPPTAEDMIAGYRQIIARAHAIGVKVHLGTITPFKGAGYWTPEGEAVRMAINAWIRTTKEADGMVDFDAAIRDSADPSLVAAAYDSRDHLHPNDAGFARMAAAVDLKRLR